MKLNWNEYNVCLIPLIKRFGSIYSQDEIQKGWFYWKNKTKDDLIEFVNVCISSGNYETLLQTTKNIPSREIYKHEDNSQNISENFLRKLLEKNNVSSLTELVFKKGTLKNET